MAIQIVPFTPDLLGAVAQFSEKVWQRPRNEAYYRWRYLECPSQAGLLALREGNCLAMVWAFPRAYRIGTQKVTCLEALDWFCVPELRKSGLGVRLMHELMKRFEPMVVVGGSADTQSILPGLGWKTLGEVPSYVLPLEGAALAGYARSRWRVPAPLFRGLFRAARPWFYPRPPIRLPQATFEPIDGLSNDILLLYDRPRSASGAVPLPDRAFIQWLIQGAPFIGQYILLEFTINRKVSGWSLSRIYSSPAGKEARIIDLYTPYEAFCSWMVGETLNKLASFRPDTIHAASGHPAIQRAFGDAHFLRHRASSVFVWPKALDFPSPVDYFGHNTSDAPFLPYYG